MPYNTLPYELVFEDFSLWEAPTDREILSGVKDYGFHGTDPESGEDFIVVWSPEKKIWERRPYSCVEYINWKANYNEDEDYEKIKEDIKRLHKETRT